MGREPITAHLRRLTWTGESGRAVAATAAALEQVPEGAIDVEGSGVFSAFFLNPMRGKR